MASASAPPSPTASRPPVDGSVAVADAGAARNLPANLPLPSSSTLSPAYSSTSSQTSPTPLAAGSSRLPRRKSKKTRAAALSLSPTSASSLHPALSFPCLPIARASSLAQTPLEQQQQQQQQVSQMQQMTGRAGPGQLPDSEYLKRIREEYRVVAALNWGNPRFEDAVDDTEDNDDDDDEDDEDKDNNNDDIEKDDKMDKQKGKER